MAYKMADTARNKPPRPNSKTDHGNSKPFWIFTTSKKSARATAAKMTATKFVTTAKKESDCIIVMSYD